MGSGRWSSDSVFVTCIFLPRMVHCVLCIGHISFKFVHSISNAKDRPSAWSGRRLVLICFLSHCNSNKMIFFFKFRVVNFSTKQLFFFRKLKRKMFYWKKKKIQKQRKIQGTLGWCNNHKLTEKIIFFLIFIEIQMIKGPNCQRDQIRSFGRSFGVCPNSNFGMQFQRAPSSVSFVHFSKCSTFLYFGQSSWCISSLYSV